MTIFEKNVYKITAQIPKGKVTTYKIIAEILKSSPRAVGNALAKNPYAPKVPCHRVIRSDLKIGGFNGQKDGTVKTNLLKAENIKIHSNKVIDNTIIFKFG